MPLSEPLSPDPAALAVFGATTGARAQVREHDGIDGQRGDRAGAPAELEQPILPAHHRRDAVAVEERADHERLGLVAAATHLDQSGLGLGRRLPLRKLDDLAPASHRCDLYHS